MKAIKRLKTGIGLVLLTLAVALSSCAQERIEVTNSEGDKATVLISLEVPSKSNGTSTRALTSDQENDVTQINVLVFEPNGGKYLRQAVGYGLSSDAGDSHKKTFTAKLVTGPCDLMILANSSTIINDLIIAEGANIFNLSSLDIEMRLKESVTGKWASNGSRPFPMWGNVENEDIQTTTSLTGAKAIKLHRMSVRVDVTVSGGVSFKLTEVHVYNWNSQGSVAPNLSPANWDTSDPSKPKAKLPNVPSTSVTNKTTPLIYQGAEIDAATNSTVQDIYLFESNNYLPDGTTLKALTDRTCLVIGGEYDTDGRTTYYRVDFANKPATQWIYLNLLRNHWYKVGITQVGGSGFETADEAFNSEPINIEAGVVEWNDGGMGDIIFNGQNYLFIKPNSEFEFFRDAETQTANIKTDYTPGWKITKITEDDGTTPNSGWITTDKTIGMLYPCNGLYLPLDITTTQNDTPDTRIGYIYIQAGRIEGKLKVVQTLDSKLRLNITNILGQEINKLEFDATTPVSKLLKVNFDPQAADLNILVTDIGFEPFDFGTGDVVTTGTLSGLSGSKNYNIFPAVMPLPANPFDERVLKVDFMVSDGVDYASKTIFLRQMNFAITSNKKNLYLIDGSTHTFDILSNTTWEVTDVSDPNGILVNRTDLIGKTGVGSTTIGEPFSFKVCDAVVISNPKDGAVTITFTDLTGKAIPYTATINFWACGKGGTAINQKIGNNYYLTHLYGIGANTRCWMVQSSKEGAAGLTTYPSTSIGARGYYYSWTQAATSAGGPCPDGWYLPSGAEATTMRSEALSNPGVLAKWWIGASSGALAGYYNASESPAWSNWNANGHFWVSNADGTAYRDFYCNANTIVGVTQYWNGYFFSVRCVRNPSDI